MPQNHYLKALQKFFGKRDQQASIGTLVEPSVAQEQSGTQAAESSQRLGERTSSTPAIYISELTFRDGTRLTLRKNSIVLITGPNNSGKSSVLKAIDGTLCERGMFPKSSEPLGGPVVAGMTVWSEGTVEQFRELIEARSLRANEKGKVRIGEFRTYDLANVREDLSNSFRGSGAATLFVAWMNAGARLDSVKPAKRNDWTTRSPTEPLQWLDFEIDAEAEVSEAFHDAFGRWLFVDRTAGENLILHVSDTEVPDLQSFKEYRNWLSSLPALQDQGDGMKSFAAAVLGIKVHPKSIILLDEPEAFLHHPQARRLAEVISNGTAPNTQVWLATHSNEIVRGLLDSSNDRVVVVRLDRRPGDVLSAKVLLADQVKTLWTDPYLRTSDILSALFHEVAVICEGETDARFFRSLSDANPPAVHMPDFEFFHVGGKDKMVSIATALRALNLPVCVVCDIDILSDKGKFLSLFSALGGERSAVEQDVERLVRHVGQRNALITGREIARSLRDIADRVDKQTKISTTDRVAIGAVTREASAWSRLKVDGYVGLESADIIRAFTRIYDCSRNVGLLINREGELEGLCRDATRMPKTAWLGEVLDRDLTTDPNLKDARDMLDALRRCILTVRNQNS